MLRDDPLNHPDNPIYDDQNRQQFAPDTASFSGPSELSSQISEIPSTLRDPTSTGNLPGSIGLRSQHETSNLALQTLSAKHHVNTIGGASSHSSEPTLTSLSAPSQDKLEHGESSNVEQKILLLLRQSLLPFSDRLDPFAQLPTTLTRFQEHLVSFYLLYYPKVTYGMSSRLQPHPVATNFALAMNMPACFQVALARSALYRLNLQKFGSEKERSDLEIAMIRHKGEAIRLVRKLSLEVDSNLISGAPAPESNVSSEVAQGGDKRKDYDSLIASIISLGTLDRRTGSEGTASMHFMAVRRLLRSSGGPLSISSVLLSRVMVHFECIYGTTGGSYVWDRPDFPNLLQELNVFLAQVWDLWLKLSENAPYTMKNSSSANLGHSSSSDTVMTMGAAPSDEQPDPQQQSPTTKTHHPFEAFALPTKSTLRTSLSRPIQPADGEQEPSPQQRANLIFQLTCLLTLTHIVTDHLAPPPRPVRSSSVRTYASNPSVSSLTTTTGSSSNTTRATSPTSVHSSSSSSFTPIYPSDLSMLQSYLSPLLTSVERANLANQPCNNHMWLLQVSDHSSQHSRRIWRAASFVWVLRQAGWRVQNMVREWLLAFVTGEMLDDDEVSEEQDGQAKTKYERKALKLDSFHFSYAS